MNTRRAFIVTAAGSGALFAASGALACASSEAASVDVLRRVGGSPVKAVFEALQGQSFQIDGGGAHTRLTLQEVRCQGSCQQLEQFSLVFRGDAQRPLEGGLYRTSHATIGRFEMRLEPNGHHAAGALYRADFSLLT